MESDLALAQRVATAILNLSVATFIGSGAATVWLRSAGSAWAAGMLPRLRKTMLGTGAVGIIAYLAILWLEAAAMAEVPLTQAFDAVQSVITSTHYGYAWMLGAVALIVVTASAAVQPSPRLRTVATAMRFAALGVFLYSRSIVSHAGAAGDFTWAVAVDWVHLVLISMWVGEVIVAGLITLGSAPSAKTKDRTDCARYVEALSTSATVALIGIFITGVLSAWRGLGGIGNVVGSLYFTTLLLKVALVLSAAALGGLNRFIVMPKMLAQLRTAPRSSHAAGKGFARVLQIEAVILIAVLVAAAFLSSTSPPMASS